jgi:hypothetical protein
MTTERPDTDFRRRGKDLVYGAVLIGIVSLVSLQWKQNETFTEIKVILAAGQVRDENTIKDVSHLEFRVDENCVEIDILKIDMNTMQTEHRVKYEK